MGKNYKLLILLLGISTIVFAGNNAFKAIDNQKLNQWIRITDDQNLDPKTYLNKYKAELGLSQNDNFEQYGLIEEGNGQNHYRYHQTYKNVKVEGSFYFLHTKNNKLHTANGRLVFGISGNENPAVDFKSALKIALDFYKAEPYWENPTLEALKQKIHNDPNASFFPEEELVWVDPKFKQDGKDYQLAWKLDLYLDMPGEHIIVFIDAQNGDIVHELEGCHSGNANGQAQTRYSSLQDIVTDSVSPGLYRLVDKSRNVDVITYDLNNSTNYGDSSHFEDADNFWDVTSNFNDGAYDAHWGTEMTMDYFFEKHGRNGFDNNGSALLSMVHYDVAFFNAFWNGLWATYGDGNNNPLTSIDVVSHEITHGVTGTSAGLIYQDESGALNESFSDIFGSAVEFYSGDPNASWIIGRSNFSLRSMSNPNSYQDPDTYLGTSWYTGSADNGGVHTNSGVQNFWYYLLVNGGSGNNDFGDAYSLNGLGMDKADSIAYRNLNIYLGPSSDHTFARQGALQAAEDIFGVCSNEYIETGIAWYAVGVGAHPLYDDFSALNSLSPNGGCALPNNATVAFEYLYQQSPCGSPLNAGDTVTLSYRLNNNPEISEEIILSANPINNQIYSHTFQTNADLTQSNTNEIEFKVVNSNDPKSNNNTFEKVVGSADELTGTFKVTMEKWFFPNGLDSFYIDNASRARAFPSIQNPSQGQWGLQFTAEEFDPAIWQEPSSPNDNFVLNQSNISKVCLCVDATSADSAKLKFDLKQTYSAYYDNAISPSIPPSLVSSFRVTVDGFRIGQEFHPTSYRSDPYVRHELSLSPFVGQNFQLCFEGQHFISGDDDSYSVSIGDNTFLDNIEIEMFQSTGLKELNAESINVYPNPAKDRLFVDHENSVEGLEFRILNIQGKEVKSGRLLNDEININQLKDGVYFLELFSENAFWRNRIVISN